MTRVSTLIGAGIVAILVTQVAVGLWIVSSIQEVRLAVVFGGHYDSKLEDLAHVLEQVAENTESIDERLMTPQEYLAKKMPRYTLPPPSRPSD